MTINYINTNKKQLPYFKGAFLGLINDNEGDKAYLIVPVYHLLSSSKIKRKQTLSKESPSHFKAYLAKSYLREMSTGSTFIWNIPVFSHPKVIIQPPLPKEEELRRMSLDENQADLVNYYQRLDKRIWNRINRIIDDSFIVQDNILQLQTELKELKDQEFSLAFEIDENPKEHKRLEQSLENLRNYREQVLQRISELKGYQGQVQPLSQQPKVISEAHRNFQRAMKRQPTRKAHRRGYWSPQLLKSEKTHKSTVSKTGNIGQKRISPVHEIPEIGDFSY